MFLEAWQEAHPVLRCQACGGELLSPGICTDVLVGPIRGSRAAPHLQHRKRGGSSHPAHAPGCRTAPDGCYLAAQDTETAVMSLEGML